MSRSDAHEPRPIQAAFLGLAHLHPRSYRLLLGFLPGVRVVAAAEANATLLDAFARDFDLRGYTDWRMLIDREGIDLALLFLPHAEAPDAAVACAEHGIHILAEKPMAADCAGIRRMIRAAREAGVVLSAPYVWRYHPVSLALRKSIAGGSLGEIFGGEGRYAAGGAGRYAQAGAGWMLRRASSGGGPMHNLGVHWIDLFRWLLGDEVAEVMGSTTRFGGDYDVEDAAQALVTFSRGAVITLDISYGAPEVCPGTRDLYIALRGRKGFASWHPSLVARKQTLAIISDEPEPGAGPRQEREVPFPPRPGYGGVCGRDFMADFIGAIREGRPPAVTAEDGLRALEVVEAIYKSAESGAAVRLSPRSARQR